MECVKDLRIVWIEGRGHGLQGLAAQEVRLFELALEAQAVGELDPPAGDRRVAGLLLPQADGQGLAVEGLGLAVIADGGEESCQGFEALRDLEVVFP